MLTISDTLRRTVLQTIDACHMFQPSDSILIGVSGGPDSVALMHILLYVSSTRRWRIGVAHLDHGLRPGVCEADARFVESMCRNLNLPCYSDQADVKQFRRQHHLSMEEAARILRYRFFYQTAAAHGFNRIALGHHADDNAELVLMNVFRGSGMTGVSGIPSTRNQIVRPLIRVRRTELIRFLEENHLPFVTDASNFDVRYTRNRIRQTILPLLESAINPNIVDTLNRFSDIMRQENDWIETLICDQLASCKTGQGSGYIRVPALAIRSLHPAAGRRIIRQAIHHVKGNLRKISFSHIEAILHMISASAIPGVIHLPDQITAIYSKDDLCIEKQDGPLRNQFLRQVHSGIGYHYEIQIPADNSSATTDIVEIGGRLVSSEISPKDVAEMDFMSASSAFLDMESLVFPLTVRHIMPGDRFKPQGTSGFQKIKKFFIDHKIDPQKRKVCPVVISNNRIVWVCGHRIDEDFKLGPTTRRILKMTFQSCRDTCES
ncbi:MAG: tRNA lysidine(34) synthetase TilS [Desulfatirhabdiaceae bacterium]